MFAAVVVFVASILHQPTNTTTSNKASAAAGPSTAGHTQQAKATISQSAMVRTSGSKSFSPSETQVLLDIVDKIRPLGKQRWDEVASQFNDKAATLGWSMRDAEALKRRFMVLAYAKKPTEEWREFMDRAGVLHHAILEEAGAAAPATLPILMSGGLAGAVSAGSSSVGGPGSASGTRSPGADDTNESMLLLNCDDTPLVSHHHGAAHASPEAAAMAAGYSEDLFKDMAAGIAAGSSSGIVDHASAAASAARAQAAAAAAAGGLAAAISNGCTALAMMTPVRTGKRGRPPGSTTGSAAKRVAAQSEQVVLLSRATLEMQKHLAEMREVLTTVVETQTNQTAVIEYLQKQIEKMSRSHGAAHTQSVPSDKTGDDEHFSSLMA